MSYSHPGYEAGYTPDKSRPSVRGEERKDGGWLYDYSSMAEFLAVAGSPFGDYRGERESHSTGSSRWYGTRNFKEAVGLAEDGWPDGAEQIERLREALEKRLAAYIPAMKVESAVYGGSYDVAALMRGEPEPALVLNRVDSPIRSVDITMNVAASAGNSTAVMMARGGVVCALVYALDRLNVPSRVTVYSAIDGHGYPHKPKNIIKVLAKAEGEPLDTAKLAFALGHPSMLRRLVLCHMENQIEPQRKAMNVGVGYGYPGSVPEAMQGEVHLDRAYYGEEEWTNTERAMRWILGRLESMGLIIE